MFNYTANQLLRNSGAICTWFYACPVNKVVDQGTAHRPEHILLSIESGRLPQLVMISRLRMVVLANPPQMFPRCMERKAGHVSDPVSCKGDPCWVNRQYVIYGKSLGI
jgi:hypothetical protein